jgi:hypothetical protein
MDYLIDALTDLITLERSLSRFDQLWKLSVLK